MDAFIGITPINFDIEESDITRKTLSKSYFVEKLDDEMFPLIYQIKEKYQQK